MKFEWDENKNRTNKIKHGLSFQEAITVFDDEYAIVIYDEPHSITEERFIIIGINMQFKEIAVCHCYRGIDNDIIRIISARKATATEVFLYGRK